MAIMLTLFIYASFSISACFYLECHCYNRRAEGLVALTFDDGIDPVMTPKVLDVLKKYDAKVTFFLIGSKAEQYPDLVRRIVEEGHDIGNHSYYHKGTFPLQSNKKIYNEIVRCSTVLEEITNVKVQYFRPPFGVTNPNVARPIKKLGLTTIGWRLRSLDTINRPIESVAKRVAKKIKSGDIVLLHDNRDDADKLVELVLNDIDRQGLFPVTISEMFEF